MNAFIQSKRPAHLYNQNPLTDSVSSANVTLLQPSANAILNGTGGPLYRWNKIAGATHYLLKVCASPCSGSNTLTEEVVLTDTFYQSTLNYPPRLSFLPYVWRVLPFNQSYSCAGLSIQQNFNTQTATMLQETETIEEVSVFPNPLRAGEDIRMKIISKKTVELELRILTISGKELKSKTLLLNKGERLIRIESSELSSGVYLLYLEEGNGRMINKIIISR